MKTFQINEIHEKQQNMKWKQNLRKIMENEVKKNREKEVLLEKIKV